MELENLARAALAAWESGEYLATEAALENLAAYLKQQDCHRADHEDTIQATCNNYASDEVNIAEPPLIALSDGGAWVSAWVWVPTEGEDECC